MTQPVPTRNDTTRGPRARLVEDKIGSMLEGEGISEATERQAAKLIVCSVVEAIMISESDARQLLSTVHVTLEQGPCPNFSRDGHRNRHVIRRGAERRPSRPKRRHVYAGHALRGNAESTLDAVHRLGHVQYDALEHVHRARHTELTYERHYKRVVPARVTTAARQHPQHGELTADEVLFL